MHRIMMNYSRIGKAQACSGLASTYLVLTLEVGHNPVSHSDHNHTGKLKPFACMKGHQPNMAMVVDHGGSGGFLLMEHTHETNRRSLSDTVPGSGPC